MLNTYISVIYIDKKVKKKGDYLIFFTTFDRFICFYINH